MLPSQIIGQKYIKAHLKKTVENGRIPHAQLFVGETGTGLLTTAIYYAKLLLNNSLNPISSIKTGSGDRVDALAHPDLHFVYPVATNNTVKKHPVSSKFLADWRKFVLDNPYGSLFEWFKHLGIENKQGLINVDEAADMVKALSLKPYAGGHKVMIVWMAEKMNNQCANKILKLIEEPPNKTVLILLTENEGQILNTIKSRCQTLRFPKLPEAAIAHGLSVHNGAAQEQALAIAQRAQGNYSKALQLIAANEGTAQFETWFVLWVRTAFKAKRAKSSINQLLGWGEALAKEGREAQKKFLEYSIDTFRQALLKNYRNDTLVFFTANKT
ncbi:MAG: ATP-binding protein, partial [Marinirhabdus sp.]